MMLQTQDISRFISVDVGYTKELENRRLRKAFIFSFLLFSIEINE